MKAAVAFTISAILLYAIFSGRAEAIWAALTTNPAAPAPAATGTGV